SLHLTAGTHQLCTDKIVKHHRKEQHRQIFQIICRIKQKRRQYQRRIFVFGRTDVEQQHSHRQEQKMKCQCIKSHNRFSPSYASSVVSSFLNSCLHSCTSCGASISAPSTVTSALVLRCCGRFRCCISTL